jgi:hypothetical protein
MSTISTTETAVLRTLSDTFGYVGVGGLTEDRLLSCFEYIDRPTLRATLYALLDRGLVEAADADWGDTQGVKTWRASAAGGRAVGHRRW